MTPMDEALIVELLAVYELGRQLTAEQAPEPVMRRYRAWRDEVLASANPAAAA